MEQFHLIKKDYDENQLDLDEENQIDLEEEIQYQKDMIQKRMELLREKINYFKYLKAQDNSENGDELDKYLGYMDLNSEQELRFDHEDSQRYKNQYTSILDLFTKKSQNYSDSECYDYGGLFSGKYKKAWQENYGIMEQIDITPLLNASKQQTHKRQFQNSQKIKNSEIQSQTLQQEVNLYQNNQLIENNLPINYQQKINSVKQTPENNVFETNNKMNIYEAVLLKQQEEQNIIPTNENYQETNVDYSQHSLQNIQQDDCISDDTQPSQTKDKENQTSNKKLDEVDQQQKENVKITSNKILRRYSDVKKTNNNSSLTKLPQIQPQSVRLTPIINGSKPYQINLKYQSLQFDLKSNIQNRSQLETSISQSQTKKKNKQNEQSFTTPQQKHTKQKESEENIVNFLPLVQSLKLQQRPNINRHSNYQLPNIKGEQTSENINSKKSIMNKNIFRIENKFINNY